jgi:hypothetical protein
MLYHADEADGEELGDLIGDCSPSILHEVVKALPNRNPNRLDVGGVLVKFPGHAWRIRWLPCEDVSIGGKEVDDRTFLFVDCAFLFVLKADPD